MIEKSKIFHPFLKYFDISGYDENIFNAASIIKIDKTKALIKLNSKV
jgi:hypothetical protein